MGDAMSTSPAVSVRDDSTGLLLTWIDDKGDFHVEQSVADVPLMGRDTVKVIDPDVDDGTHADRVFVVDLRSARPDGSYPVSVMPRSEFDAIAVARRQLRGPTLASASAARSAPPLPPPPTAQGQGRGDMQRRPLVIVYGAQWCGPCHEAAAYLRKKGITFVEKDIERDKAAQREMQTKLTQAGLHAGSIPVLDVGGKMLVGFNPQAVDDALGKTL